MTSPLGESAGSQLVAPGQPQATSLRDWATFGSVLIAACERYAEREAIVDGAIRLSYAEMAAAISQMVQALRELGLHKGDALGLLSANRYELVIAIAAASLMGLRFTALRGLGSEDDHAYLLEDAAIGVLLVDSDTFAARAEALAKRENASHRTVCLGPVGHFPDLLEMMKQYTPSPLVDESSAEDIAFIGYTGGTTGRPKGVVHTHASFAAFNMLELLEWEWPADVRFLAASPITHAAISWIMPTFMQGGSFVINHGFSAEQFLSTVERERITMSFVVPTMLYALLDYPRRTDFDTSSLENVLYGAAPMSQPRLVEAIGAFGPVFSQLYGQTEAPTVLAYLPRAQHNPAQPQRMLSCGFPTKGVTIRLLNERNQEVPIGDVGEICVRGPLVMRGYWQQPEATAEVLADGWLHTGDLARRDAAGYLYIVGRSKDMIISGGFNVYPKEVEDALALHPAVAAATVIGLPDPVWGEQVTAVIVLREGFTGDKREIAAFVKAKKGSDHTPKRIEFVDQIPTTALGKFDKTALRAFYSDQAA